MIKSIINRLKYVLTIRTNKPNIVPTEKDKPKSSFKQYLADNCISQHNWSKWNQSEENRSTIYPQTNKEFKYKRTVQIRRCLNCNKIEKEYI